MSRIDPSIVKGIRPMPTPVELEQQRSLIEDRQAQMQERQAQADALRAANETRRQTYNANKAIDAYRQMNPDASIEELSRVGGSYGVPYLETLTKQRKDEADALKAHADIASKLTSDLIDAFSLEPDVSKHPQLEQEIVKQYIQNGEMSVDHGNQILAEPPNSLLELKAHQKAAEIAQKKAEADALQAERDAQRLNAEATRKKTELETSRMAQNLPANPPNPTAQIPGRDIPLPKDVESQKIRIANAEKQATMGPEYTPSPAGSSPEQILAKYPPTVREMAKQLVAYKRELPGGVAQTRAPWTDAIQAASELDPSWSAADYPSRLRVINDFKSGPTSKTITSLNTVIGHLDSLQKAADALHNRSIPLYNRAVNAALTGAGNPSVTKFEIPRNAVADELTKVFRATGGSESDVKNWRDQVSAAGSPDQLRGAVDTALELLGSRMNALQDQWERGMNKPKDFTFLSPKSRAILQNMGKDANTLEAGGSATDSNGMIKVQIPGHPPGQIPAAQLQQFLRDNPGGKQLQ